jgi:hypothetical protein
LFQKNNALFLLASDVRSNRDFCCIVGQSMPADRSAGKDDETGLLELLVLGGAPAPSTPAQFLAVYLLYAPRPMQDAKSVAIPAWSAAAASVSAVRYQFDKSAGFDDETGGKHLIAVAKSQFRSQQSTDRNPRRLDVNASYERLQLERSWQTAWKSEAGAALWSMDRRVFGTADVRYGGRLKYAPFWMRKYDMNFYDDGDFITISRTILAYALSWYHATDTAFLEIVVEESDGRYLLLRLKDGAGSHTDDKVVAFAPFASESNIYFDQDMRLHTILSTALAALDPTTGQIAGVGIICGCIDLLPKELAAVVVSYLLLPTTMPAAMAAWIETNVPYDLSVL